MLDILIRNVEDSLANRIKAIARERNWSINDTVLHLLRYAAGLSTEDVVSPMQDIALLSGTWDPKEAAAFRSAIEAFEDLAANPTIVELDPPKR